MSTEMRASELYTRAVTAFDTVLRTLPADRYAAPTPCVGWDVRALVNHVVGEDRWAAELLAGRTIADVGSDLDGDLLGADPVAAWSTATAAARRAVDAAGDDDVVALSAGPQRGPGRGRRLGQQGRAAARRRRRRLRPSGPDRGPGPRAAQRGRSRPAVRVNARRLESLTSCVEGSRLVPQMQVRRALKGVGLYL
jgi:hypothetical protein